MLLLYTIVCHLGDVVQYASSIGIVVNHNHKKTLFNMNRKPILYIHRKCSNMNNSKVGKTDFINKLLFSYWNDSNQIFHPPPPERG